MLPLSLLKTAINHPMLVELKNGETYNGHLASCDAWMNVYLTQSFISIHARKDGDRFWKMSECYIRGSTIKYMRIPDEVIENYKEDTQSRGGSGRRDGYQNNRGGGRGGGGGGRPAGQAGGQNRGNFNNGNAGRGGFSNQNRRPNQGSNQNLSGGRPAKQPRK